jgi:hypothetical protein
LDNGRFGRELKEQQHAAWGDVFSNLPSLTELTLKGVFAIDVLLPHVVRAPALHQLTIDPPFVPEASSLGHLMQQQYGVVLPPISQLIDVLHALPQCALRLCVPRSGSDSEPGPNWLALKTEWTQLQLDQRPRVQISLNKEIE